MTDLNELPLMRENLDRARDELRALEMVNVSGMTTTERVALDIRIKRAEANWTATLNRYNAAIDLAASEPAGVPRQRTVEADWCIDPESGCRATGRCPRDPVCGN